MIEPQTAERFVVFCQARTGTHLLRSSLDSHPQIRCAWEPFNDKVVQDFPYGVETPVANILHQLWKAEEGVSASGFPLHLSHGRGGRAWGEVWKLLRDDHSVRKFHLYRRNLFEQLVSHRLALTTGHWTLEPGELIERPPSITLDFEELRAWFESAASAIYLQQWNFNDAQLLTYESLAADLQSSIEPVLNSLNVTPFKVAPKTQKQGASVYDTVRNISELRAKFAGSRWASFFEGSEEHVWDQNLPLLDLIGEFPVGESGQSRESRLET